jgi:hypothetical protein
MTDDYSTEFINFSPFADPVVSACFNSVETAGLAVRSLGNSVTEQDGITIAEVISVTPQSYSKIPGQRGTRVDVKSKTAAKQELIYEVNMYPDRTIHQRNFLAAAQAVTEGSSEGTTASQFTRQMPHTICINILDFDVRKDNDDWLQPTKYVYTKEPIAVALPQFIGYDIVLPRFRHAPQDFASNLYCWVYALDQAHRTGKTIKEVVEMTTELRAFEVRDSGFRQFCDRYQLVATDPGTRNEFHKWRRELMRQQGLLDAAFEDGEARGVARGEARGEARSDAKWQAKVENLEAQWQAKVAEIEARSEAKVAELVAGLAELKARLEKYEGNG